ncbi:HNH endonuclease family protein [Corynebacterium aquilae]|uniref:GmrSD restriction endonucleases C-terminal domain-containing protein n=1 Tax=Corynebacterium aquilae DSM 44791 TaxID=1431546 RepID=A0A1L7CFB7_9CORY|nr:HNH endonuclease family protein [Corynebacterium aquilae]APT84525.1 hypothetical protein CAQU_05040 [Corynebacterium aquilae DSM 44791]
MRRRFVILGALSALLAAGQLAVAWQSPPATPGHQPPPLAQSLSQVPTTAQRPRVLGYQRSHFGRGWAADPSGCTTRHTQLQQQLAGTTVDASCRIRGGQATCPYTGAAINSTNVELDHVFPLAAAWDLGAATWSEQQRISFANDPDNLIVVATRANRDKSDQLPAEWMPPASSARCWYARKVAVVAARYQLALTEEDIATMKRSCLVRELPLRQLG